MHKRLVLSCECGSPEDEKVWSGTPFRIAQGLGAAGVEVVAVNSNPGRLGSLLARLLSSKSSFGPQTLVEKFLRRHLFVKAFKQSGVQQALHLSTGDMLQWARPANERSSIFCDATWHLWSGAALDATNISSGFIRRADKRERAAYASAHHIFSISEYVKADLVNHYGIAEHKITVVGTGRGNLKPFVGHKDYSSGKVLFVAKNRFVEKGGLLLLDAFRIAKAKNPSLSLTIVGGDELRPHAQGIEDVEVTGFISWEQLQAHFDTAVLYAMPALYEPWGLVYLEALASAMAVLGLNRNALPEITQGGRYGYLVDEPRAESVAQAILGAFDSVEQLRTKAVQGQAYCLHRYRWESCVQEIDRVLFGDTSRDEQA